MGARDPVEEEQALAVVELVLQSPSLEHVGLDHDPLGRAGQLAADGHASGPWPA